MDFDAIKACEAMGIYSSFGTHDLDRPPTPDPLWSALCALKLADAGDGVAAALCLVEEALDEESRR